MSMKKTDLEKHLAKKIDGQMKKGAVPQRFGKGSGAVKEKPEEAARPAAPKLVSVSYRLPVELVDRMRAQAAGQEGGVSALVAQAVEQWLVSVANKGGEA